jgi:hypothetical protein
MQTMSALDAVDLVAEYIAHGLTIPMTLKGVLDAETLAALNEVEELLNGPHDIENPHEPCIAGIHSPPDDVQRTQTLQG